MNCKAANHPKNKNDCGNNFYLFYITVFSNGSLRSDQPTLTGSSLGERVDQVPSPRECYSKCPLGVEKFKTSHESAYNCNYRGNFQKIRLSPDDYTRVCIWKSSKFSSPLWFKNDWAKILSTLSGVLCNPFAMKHYSMTNQLVWNFYRIALILSK